MRGTSKSLLLVGYIEICVLHKPQCLIIALSIKFLRNTTRYQTNDNLLVSGISVLI